MSVTETGHSAHGYQDPYGHPELPLVKRLILAANPELTPDDLYGVGEGDGAFDEVSGLLADHDWHHDLAVAETLGLRGDWGTDDVREAVTEALHRARAGHVSDLISREQLQLKLNAAALMLDVVLSRTGGRFKATDEEVRRARGGAQVQTPSRVGDDWLVHRNPDPDFEMPGPDPRMGSVTR